MKLIFKCILLKPSSLILSDDKLGIETDDSYGIISIEEDIDLLENILTYKNGYHEMDLYIHVLFSENELLSIPYFELRPSKILSLCEKQKTSAAVAIFEESETINISRYGKTRILNDLNLGQVRASLDRCVYGIIEDAGEMAVNQSLFLQFFEQYCERKSIGTDKNGNPIFLISPYKKLPQISDSDSVYLRGDVATQCGFLAYDASDCHYEIARISDPIPYISGSPYSVISRDFKNALDDNKVEASYLPVFHAESEIYKCYHEKHKTLLELFRGSGKKDRVRLFIGCASVGNHLTGLRGHLRSPEVLEIEYS